MASYWILEFRTRTRSNGKWSEWRKMVHPERPTTAWPKYPSEQVVYETYYQRRAVEYKRIEPEASR